MRKPGILLILAPLALAACGKSQTAPPSSTELLGPAEVLHFTGTEPFWGGEVAGSALRYTTPENPAGAAIAVTRFDGKGGIAYSGMLDGQHFDLAVSEGNCSDGMSDRAYPFIATLTVRGEQRNGCAWSERRPYRGGGEGPGGAAADHAHG